MPRRRLPDDPYSRLAIWSRRFALFAVAAIVISIVLLRSGVVEVVPGLMTFGAALTVAALAILLALGSFITIWRQGLRGTSYAVLALFIGGALLAYPVYLGVRAYQLPAIADITTDVIDPPSFDAIRRLRSRTTNPVQYAGLYAAQQQQDAYPDVSPLEISASPKIAYDQALALVNKRRWLVMDAREPQPGRRDGRIEAVARTPVMGFRDDIVIRIRGTDEEARVDMRSSSRYGQHDLGSNAARIQEYLETLEQTIDVALERELQRRPAPKKAPAPKAKNLQAQTPAKR